METNLKSPTAGERGVLIRVRAVGIFGTGIATLRGDLPAAISPLVLGHEISGARPAG